MGPKQETPAFRNARPIEGPSTMTPDLSCADYARTTATRRTALKAGLGLGLLPWLGPSALAQVRTKTEADRTLVVVFLRGGADGLNLLVPHGDDAYYRARPTLGIPERKLVGTGDRFGFAPALAPLLPLWEEGRLAAIPACGSGDASRSHFEAMATMEAGRENGAERRDGGWLARYIAATPERDAALRALAFGETMPDSLRGAPGAVATNSIRDLRLPEDDAFLKGLRKAYGEGPLRDLGTRSLEIADRLKTITTDGKRGGYPDSPLGAGLSEVAALLRAGIGLEIACLDSELWDTHVAQGADEGWHAGLARDLAASLAAFAKDLGPRLAMTTILVMTEFGRRVEENAGLGTDHGRAGLAVVLGGGVKGGRILGDWPGLEKSALDEVGDLPPVNDYRPLLRELLAGSLGFQGELFPTAPKWG